MSPGRGRHAGVLSVPRDGPVASGDNRTAPGKEEGFFLHLLFAPLCSLLVAIIIIIIILAPATPLCERRLRSLTGERGVGFRWRQEEKRN